MIPSPTIRQRTASSALVITLLGIVLLTVIVLAFMQTMTLGLTTSKSYLDIRRATMAAQAGLDTAVAQITLASSTNLAFVTGLTNYTVGTTNYPLTVIGTGNLTNLDQVMPLVSGPLSYFTNFGVAGFSNNFTAYSALRMSGSASQVVDVNTPYDFIETNITGASSVNVYQAPWVTMTNVVGSQVNYTRYAYIVLDDSARLNPTLMTGAGSGFTNSTNWYTGAQDINATLVTNNGNQLLTSTQLNEITNAASSFGYSDATLAEAYSSRAAYEAVKVYFTSQTNASYDVIPAWYPNGGMPKYNINDLATNTAYGASALARSLNIARIITNNLPNFYTRDPALTAAPDTTHFLYPSRLAANIVDYISPDYPGNVFYNTDYSYSSNQAAPYAGISPQGHGVFPVFIAERNYVVAGAGSGGSATTNSSVVSQFWLSCWNPYTTPVTIHSANLHISSRPGYYLGTGPTNSPADYTNAVSIISGYNGASGSPTLGTATGPALVNPSYVVNPNEFVVMGFAPQTNIVTGSSTTAGPSSMNQTNNYLPTQVASRLEQFALNINGQTTAQSGAQSTTAPLTTPAGMSGGLSYDGHQFGTANTWVGDNIEVYGSEVADPRFASYMNNVWFTHGSQSDSYTGIYWKGVETAGGSRTWDFIYPPPIQTTIPVSMWQNRDNIARDASAGSVATSDAVTPDQLADEYNNNTPTSSNPTGDSNAAPEVIRNGPMVSIGELGHVFDPANANDALTAATPRWDNGGYAGMYENGGARSLRIGRPEENGTPTTVTSGGGSAASYTWDTNGLRAIYLLDLFTINNGNSNAIGQTNSISQSLTQGGALGRVNINTASSNVLASVFSQVQITSDPGMTNSSGALITPMVLTNIPSMVSNVIANRPYSSLSDLYKITPLFDTNVNYYPSPTVAPYYDFSDGGYANNASDNNGNDPYLIYPAALNVFNRVHQEAFGKLVQHVTVQSRAYRVYVIGQVLDNSQNPHGSVAMEVGVNLQYNPNEGRYNPVIQYLRLLK